mmetsp:Transcript_31300/g.79165  ORF Transcript_31300/g.79165 Transcript_31300/m.79165 type:complete len:225 (-) Transcript_31300:304-978(-)
MLRVLDGLRAHAAAQLLWRALGLHVRHDVSSHVLGCHRLGSRRSDSCRCLHIWPHLTRFLLLHWWLLLPVRSGDRLPTCGHCLDNDSVGGELWEPRLCRSGCHLRACGEHPQRSELAHGRSPGPLAWRRHLIIRGLHVCLRLQLDPRIEKRDDEAALRRYLRFVHDGLHVRRLDLYVDSRLCKDNVQVAVDICCRIHRLCRRLARRLPNLWGEPRPLLVGFLAF